jgi:hypothetical protein
MRTRQRAARAMNVLGIEISGVAEAGQKLVVGQQEIHDGREELRLARPLAQFPGLDASDIQESADVVRHGGEPGEAFEGDVSAASGVKTRAS